MSETHCKYIVDVCKYRNNRYLGLSRHDRVDVLKHLCYQDMMDLMSSLSYNNLESEFVETFVALTEIEYCLTWWGSFRDKCMLSHSQIDLCLEALAREQNQLMDNRMSSVESLIEMVV